MRKMVFLGLFLVFAAPVSADELLPGDFANQSCIDCHEKQTPQPVLQWRASAHAPTVADCVACHGERHDGAAARSRRNDTCTGCHGGPESSVVRSYVTSKHGVIAAIEGDRWDWSRRLAEANYRAPTCAYCHLYDGRHDIGRAIAPWNPLYNGDAAAFEEARENAEEPCRDCHSPRYIETLFAAGDRGMGIGRRKMREAKALLDRLGGPETEEELRRLLKNMESKSLKSLWHGTVHQSPDYQWWFGQAALDGDLLRIKAAVSRLQRKRTLSGGKPSDGQ
ncbi:MAG: hypothetical protein HN377_11015 [Alphaproteobacteria bacterium]|jgi:hypothetical protein|nr:hypothetical protein [Alphaproteobacteria bacterium]MBT7942299.1 hypothetical protein [Alphaproteobacteria bacterium]